MIDRVALVNELTVPVEKSNSDYCGNFYKGLYVQKNTSDSVSVSACCVNTLSPNSYQFIDFVNNPYLLGQRTNQRSPGCNECWRQESSGQKSYRQMANQWYTENFPDDDPFEVRLVKLDYNLDPVCNAKCITCGSWFSSLWAQEDRQFGQEGSIRAFGDVKKNSAAHDLDLGSLRRIYFNGGEPLLSQELEDILRRIQHAQGNLHQLHCQLSTNGSIVPDHSLVELWKQCKQVDIWISLDAVNTEFEYIRYPLQFDQVWENCCFMGTLASNIRIGFSFTIGVHNIDHYATAIDWIDRNSSQLNSNGWGINHCYGNLAVDKASTTLLESWKQKFKQEDTQWQKDLLQQICDVQGQPDDSIWQNHLSMIDHRRGLNWRHSLPDLAAQEKLASESQ